MTGLIAQQFAQHHAEASDLATEQIRLLEAIDDPALTVGFAVGALAAKLQAGELHEVLRLADRIVTLADGDASMGSGVIGSPWQSGWPSAASVDRLLGCRAGATTSKKPSSSHEARM